MDSTGFFGKFIISISFLHITEAVLTSWLIIILLLIFSFISTRKLCLKPGAYQTILEGIITTMQNAIYAVLPQQTKLVFPFIATLWIFILLSNLIGIIPGFHSPTADISVTAGLALLVFLSVHWFGIRAEGVKNYLRHYLRPSPILLPFHIISEISRTLAMAIRLFGNIMSLQLVALIVLMVAGFLIPIPLLILHIVEACIQTYIFGMLALIYIAGGIQVQELRKIKNSEIKKHAE
ncbi:MAG: F0F1 ATP synthase subunit A [Gammaproteobacteria bacterium]|jgi:F-type H+-transporting ATPase subunit a